MGREGGVKLETQIPPNKIAYLKTFVDNVEIGIEAVFRAYQ